MPPPARASERKIAPTIPSPAAYRPGSASGDDLTDIDDLGRKMMRQLAGAFMGYEMGAWLPNCAAPGATRPARKLVVDNHTLSGGPRLLRKRVAFEGERQRPSPKLKISARLKDPEPDQAERSRGASIRSHCSTAAHRHHQLAIVRRPNADVFGAHPLKHILGKGHQHGQ